jgi:hypothetical protein
MHVSGKESQDVIGAEERVLFRSGEIIGFQGRLRSLRRWLIFALITTLVAFSCTLLLAVEDAQAKGNNSPNGGSGQGQGGDAKGDASGGGDAKQTASGAFGGGDAKQAKGDAKGDAGAAPGGGDAKQTTSDALGGGDAKQTTGDALGGSTNQAKDDALRLDTVPVRQGAPEQTGEKLQGAAEPVMGTASEAAAAPTTLGQEEEKGLGGLTKPADEATKPLVEEGGGVAPTLKETTQPLQPVLQTATQPLQPVLQTATQPVELDPRVAAAVALDTARNGVEATLSYPPVVVVVSEPHSTVTTTTTTRMSPSSSSSLSFSGVHPRLFDSSSLGVGYLTEQLGGAAAAAAAAKFSQNDGHTPSNPLSPLGGFPFGALPAGNFFSGVGTGIGLGFLAILALLPLLVRAGRLSWPSREVFKLVSSSSLITERPG